MAYTDMCACVLVCVCVCACVCVCVRACAYVCGGVVPECHPVCCAVLRCHCILFVFHGCHRRTPATPCVAEEWTGTCSPSTWLPWVRATLSNGICGLHPRVIVHARSCDPLHLPFPPPPPPIPLSWVQKVLVSLLVSLTRHGYRVAIPEGCTVLAVEAVHQPAPSASSEALVLPFLSLSTPLMRFAFFQSLIVNREPPDCLQRCHSFRGKGAPLSILLLSCKMERECVRSCPFPLTLAVFLVFLVSQTTIPTPPGGTKKYGSPSGGFGPVCDDGYGVSYMVVVGAPR